MRCHHHVPGANRCLLRRPARGRFGRRLRERRSGAERKEDDRNAGPDQRPGPNTKGNLVGCPSIGSSGVHHAMSGTISSATMLMILIRGLTAGPAVSLYGSPTVSPVTAALCASEPLPP